MNEVEIKQSDYDYLVKKPDVWIVYTKNGKHWVCKINGINRQNGFYILKLATKAKSE